MKKFFCTKTELLNFKFNLPLAILDIIVSGLVSNGLYFFYDILVDVQLVSSLLLSNIREPSTEAKTRKF